MRSLSMLTLAIVASTFGSIGCDDDNTSALPAGPPASRLEEMGRDSLPPATQPATLPATTQQAVE